MSRSKVTSGFLDSTYINNHGPFETTKSHPAHELKHHAQLLGLLQTQSTLLKYVLNRQAICDEKGPFKEVSLKERHSDY